MQADVLRQREVEDEAAALAVLGDVADAFVQALARGLTRHVAPADADRPLSLLVRPVKASISSV